jgi:3'-phosphoadenosine 5'-phosphosulfate sulfotransferase (PAPS reductase)/FAD synthetase
VDDFTRSGYLAHAMLPAYKRQVRRSLEIITESEAVMHRPYASMSFGKDSTVMVHLLLTVRPDITVMYVDCGKWDEWPDTPRVKHELLAIVDCPNFVELRGPSIMEAYLKSGFYIQDEEHSRETKKAQRDYGQSLAAILDAEAKRRGFNGVYMGIRKEECDNRKRLFAMRGYLYYARTREAWTCHPLMHWTARDIWAYIVQHNLPYNELYDLDPRGRELARNGAMFGSRTARYGRLIFIRQIYPELFGEFTTHFPEITRWT